MEGMEELEDRVERRKNRKSWEQREEEIRRGWCRGQKRERSGEAEEQGGGEV